jgi:formamidopyrimidine-DNA glycosylase
VPEGLEAEIWRTGLTAMLGRRITRVWVDDRVAPPGFVHEVTGSSVAAIRRVGKVVLIDTDGPTIGLHFGMTGRVVIDGDAPIDQLEYASGQDRPEWDRLRLFTNGARAVAAVRLNDPRRLGRISIDPDLAHLGVDMFDLSVMSQENALKGRRIAIKTALLDQTALAGLGNLCADEVLWWAGIDPHRPASSLDSDEMKRLAEMVRRRLPIMLRRGGSTTGVLSPEVRAACPPCERDGHPLRRDLIASRTAVWCPGHQR